MRSDAMVRINFCHYRRLVLGFPDGFLAKKARIVEIICKTHCGLVTPYGDSYLGQHLAQVMACFLTAPNHIKANSQEMPQPSIT